MRRTGTDEQEESTTIKIYDIDLSIETIVRTKKGLPVLFPLILQQSNTLLWSHSTLAPGLKS